MTTIVAHRGLHQELRENTLPAFAAALAVGADGVELDVRRTLDGALVVHHDPTVAGAVIAQSLAADLPEYVPTLEAALAALGGAYVNVEIKNIRHDTEPTYDSTGDFARSVLEVLASAGTTSMIVSSFDLATCELVAREGAGIEVGWLLWDQELTSAIELAARRGLHAVHPYYSLVDQSVLEHAHREGLQVNVWTVNDAAAISAMLELGVDSVITDDPATGVALRGSSR